MTATAKLFQLQGMEREGAALLKKMDNQAKKKDYTGLRSTLKRATEVRKRIAIVLKGH